MRVCGTQMHQKPSDMDSRASMITGTRLLTHVLQNNVRLILVEDARQAPFKGPDEVEVGLTFPR